MHSLFTARKVGQLCRAMPTHSFNACLPQLLLGDSLKAQVEARQEARRKQAATHTQEGSCVPDFPRLLPTPHESSRGQERKACEAQETAAARFAAKALLNQSQSGQKPFDLIAPGKLPGKRHSAGLYNSN